jgi:hypothetical protein
VIKSGGRDFDGLVEVVPVVELAGGVVKEGGGWNEGGACTP